MHKREARHRERKKTKSENEVKQTEGRAPRVQLDTWEKDTRPHPLQVSRPKVKSMAVVPQEASIAWQGGGMRAFGSGLTLMLDLGKNSFLSLPPL